MTSRNARGLREPSHEARRALRVDAEHGAVQERRAGWTIIAKAHRGRPRVTRLLESDLEKVEPRLPRRLYGFYLADGKSCGSPDCGKGPGHSELGKRQGVRE